MEYLLIKIYSNPIDSLKTLTNSQLKYFYHYFKYECSFQKFMKSSDSTQDKKKDYQIYKKIKQELQKRIHPSSNSLNNKH
jgi:hypothetical protein